MVREERHSTKRKCELKRRKIIKKKVDKIREKEDQLSRNGYREKAISKILKRYQKYSKR
jgi:hypothetical protein